MLVTWKLSPHSFSKSKLETVGPFSSFPISSLFFGKKDTMPSLSASSSNQSGELRGPSTLWEELANQVLWIVLPSGSPRAPGIPFTKLGAARFLNNCIVPPWNTRPHTKRNTPLASRFENHGTSSGDLGSPIFAKDGPHTTCARSPFASGQILPLAALDSGALFVQKHAFGGSFRKLRHLFR